MEPARRSVLGRGACAASRAGRASSQRLGCAPGCTCRAATADRRPVMGRAARPTIGGLGSPRGGGRVGRAQDRRARCARSALVGRARGFCSSAIQGA
jgi:hypothetical protein